jgi:Asp-tRNA(Asn)/Glu-tRNA(Gln) amidotransferase C subunit
MNAIDVQPQPPNQRMNATGKDSRDDESGKRNDERDEVLAYCLRNEIGNILVKIVDENSATCRNTE